MNHSARFLLAMFLLAGIPLRGHAILLKSSPAADSAVTAPSVSVLLTFNSRIDGRRSRLTLIGPDASESPLKLETQNSPQTLGTQLDNLKPGAYHLRWQVLAVDGHITRGEITFRVQPH